MAEGAGLGRLADHEPAQRPQLERWRRADAGQAEDVLTEAIKVLGCI